MKRQRSNGEIVEEIFNGRPFVSPPDVELTRIIKEDLKRLVEALFRGDAPASQQRRAARLIEALTDRHRGRPKNRLKESRSQLARTIDWLAAAHAGKGVERPLDAAIKETLGLEIAEGRAPSEQTQRKYYHLGLREMLAADIAFARRIDAAVQGEASPETVDAALKADAGDYPGALYVKRASYERGKRAAKGEKK